MNFIREWCWRTCFKVMKHQYFGGRDAFKVFDVCPPPTQFTCLPNCWALQPSYSSTNWISFLNESEPVICQLCTVWLVHVNILLAMLLWSRTARILLAGCLSSTYHIVVQPVISMWRWMVCCLLFMSILAILVCVLMSQLCTVLGWVCQQFLPCKFCESGLPSVGSTDYVVFLLYRIVLHWWKYNLLGWALLNRH